MRNASSSRWLLLLAGLAGLAALAGCAQMPGGAGYSGVQVAPHLARERYLVPASDPDRVAQTHALEGDWAKMGNDTSARSTPPVVAASDEPVIHTSSVQMSTVEPPVNRSLATPGPGAPRSLYDKQPWEVELDKMVRGICRGC